VLQGREDGKGRKRWEKTRWNLRSRECSQPRENYQTREKLKENPTLRRIACEGISGWLADAVGVSSRLELLDSSGWANVLNFVTKGSFVHQITTTRLLATF
jgi:hypothetical protein